MESPIGIRTDDSTANDSDDSSADEDIPAILPTAVIATITSDLIPQPPQRLPSPALPKPSTVPSRKRPSATRPPSSSKARRPQVKKPSGRGPGRWAKGTKKSDYGENVTSGPGLPGISKTKQYQNPFNGRRHGEMKDMCKIFTHRWIATGDGMSEIKYRVHWKSGPQVWEREENIPQEIVQEYFAHAKKPTWSTDHVVQQLEDDREVIMEDGSLVPWYWAHFKPRRENAAPSKRPAWIPADGIPVALLDQYMEQKTFRRNGDAEQDQAQRPPIALAELLLEEKERLGNGEIPGKSVPSLVIIGHTDTVLQDGTAERWFGISQTRRRGSATLGSGGLWMAEEELSEDMVHQYLTGNKIMLHASKTDRRLAPRPSAATAAAAAAAPTPPPVPAGRLPARSADAARVQALEGQLRQLQADLSRLQGGGGGVADGRDDALRRCAELEFQNQLLRDQVAHRDAVVANLHEFYGAPGAVYAMKAVETAQIAGNMEH